MPARTSRQAGAGAIITAQIATVESPQYSSVELVYMLKKGDSLSSIGRQFGVEYPAIVKLNNIDDPDLIYPGQVFKIPNA